MAAATFSRASSAVISSAVPRAMLSAPSLHATRTKKVLVPFFGTLRPKAGRSLSMTVRSVWPNFWSRKVRRTVRSLMVAWMRTGMSPLSVPLGRRPFQGNGTAVLDRQRGPRGGSRPKADSGLRNCYVMEFVRRTEAGRVSLNAPSVR